MVLTGSVVAIEKQAGAGQASQHLDSGDEAWRADVLDHVLATLRLERQRDRAAI